MPGSHAPKHLDVSTQSGGASGAHGAVPSGVWLQDSWLASALSGDSLSDPALVGMMWLELGAVRYRGVVGTWFKEKPPRLASKGSLAGSAIGVPLLHDFSSCYLTYLFWVLGHTQQCPVGYFYLCAPESLLVNSKYQMGCQDQTLADCVQGKYLPHCTLWPHLRFQCSP